MIILQAEKRNNQQKAQFLKLRLFDGKRRKKWQIIN